MGTRSWWSCGEAKTDAIGLTAEEAAAYNAHLDGAVKAGDPKN